MTASCNLTRAIGLAFTLASAGVCAADNAGDEAAGYPSRPIRVIVPYAPGGGTDVLARLIGAKLAEKWGQSIVIDNRAGGGTVIGCELAARAPADGYTLLYTTGTLAVNATLYPKLPFDAVRSFEPVTLTAIAPNVLVVHPSVPAKRVQDLVRLAKARPGALTYSSSGNGGTGHLAMEMLKQMAKVNMVHVPYKGAGPATTAVMSGEVSASITNLIAAMPQVKAGRLRALAVTTAKRSSALPGVPTIAESGYPGFDASGWFAVFAPAKTPQAIVAKLSDEVRNVLRLPDVRRNMELQGAEPVGSTPAELAQWMQAEVERWRRVLTAANIKTD
jgi:tripartite-type tricarboxylate transporter receptor subunit TctC